MYTLVYTYLQVQTITHHIHTDIHTYTHNVRTYIHIYISIYIHTYIYICVHMCMYICVHMRVNEVIMGWVYVSLSLFGSLIPNWKIGLCSAQVQRVRPRVVQNLVVAVQHQPSSRPL